MYSLRVLLTLACASMIAAQPTRRGDALLGPYTCPAGNEFKINENAAATGAVSFANWIAGGADGLVDANGNFRGSLGHVYNGVTFFACDYKSNGQGSFITGNLVQQVLGGGAYLDAKCGTGRAGYERSNDLTIGRTFEHDHYC